VTSTSPANNATNVGRTANITVTFSEAMTASTISATTIVLKNSGGTVIAAPVTYNATSHVATINPTATLGLSTTYTLTILGGATDPRVKDAAGNAMAANKVITFKTGLL
jgi:hypothetical protein